MGRVKSLVALRFTEVMACVGLIFPLALCGCSKVQVKMGWRVSLAKMPVVSMEASMPNGSAIAPGEKSPLVVTFAQPSGTVLVTEGKDKGKVLWKDLVVTANIVSVNKKGIVSLPRDPRISDGKTGHVAITAPSHPGLSTELNIPLRYDYAFVTSFAGGRGGSGINGIDGTDGMSGSMGSIDPDNPSPGGDGTNGTSGTDGQDGGAGGDAPPIQIRVTLRSGSHPLLQAGVSVAGHKERFFLVDPKGGSLTVNSEGGPGGSGGKGGRGGRGGSGGIGTPNGRSGSDGSSGRDGSDGRPGNAGGITVTYDPQVKPFLATIRLSNPGGTSPVFKEESVAALWEAWPT
jgi:hypothetical protein